ncbi:MAG TPA: NADH-quinone oxidoreductase subunit J [Gammaproteobacteria bacterium]|nr:NADH-quinone oxidoreductase subunit J [Gammaproteobacteria bacterium]
MFESLIFYFFGLVALTASLGVIFSQNPVRAVLFLVLTFFTSAAIWLMLEAEFLAIALVLVYVGAVMVLFLFVVMMLDIEVGTLKLSFKRHIPLGLFILCLMIATLILAIGPHHFGLDYIIVPERASASYSNIEALGELLFTQYILPFEVAGVILLVAMIAAIALAFRGHRSRKQNIQKQIFTTKQDRLHMVKMPSETGEAL